MNITYEMDTRWGPVWLLLLILIQVLSRLRSSKRTRQNRIRETTNVSASWYSEDGSVNIRAYVDNVMDNESYYALST